jgi:DNA-binding MarR family transcriptional regulator
VARRIAGSLSRKYADEFNITIPEWRVIAHLAEQQACSSGEIGERTAMDKAKVNRAVTRLVASGLVLASTSTEDRRLNVLKLSRRGRDVYARIVPIALSHEASLLEALTPAEHRTLLEILVKLQRRLDSSKEFAGESGD